MRLIQFFAVKHNASKTNAVGTEKRRENRNIE